MEGTLSLSLSLSLSLIISVLTAGSRVVNAAVPARAPYPPVGNGTKLLSYNESTSKALVPSTLSLEWVATGEDEKFIYQSDQGALIIEDVVNGENVPFVAADKVPADYHEYWIKPDLTKVLWATNYTKQYRHSYFADYYIMDPESGALEPLVEDQVGDIQYAEWSPAANTIAFVRGNNLYIWQDGVITQITFDGGPDAFNAVPDWVYEEEILVDRFALWFSPDGKRIAYLSFNETGVETITIPYYMNNQSIAPSYPQYLDIRYPKVSAKNPEVAFHLLDLSTFSNFTVPVDAFSVDDLIIGEVAWVTDAHSNVIFRAYNRVQDHEKLVSVDVDAGTTLVVRERAVDTGWLDNNLAVIYLGPITDNGTYSNASYYVDLSDESGWEHIYLFPVNGGTAIPLTSGEWEVRDVLKVDTTRGLVYYTSTEHHSTESHIYSVSYKTFKKTPLVDDTVAGYWDAYFSISGAYYVLSYEGPDVPYQELYSINSTTPLRTLTGNADFYADIQTYKLPRITYFEIEHPSGYSFNVMQRLPANFDPSKKYPVLFTPYGGPGSQEVSKQFQSLNWRAYVASDPELEYATWTVDNRGTGYKGRAFRALVTRQLGKLEAADQVWAAQQLAANASWVDASKIAMWGWSYGGFLTAKVIETDSGVFSLGLITAPATDLRFYDSMNTERYMKTFEMNAAGYNESAVREAAGFKNIAGGFLIMHGTGDDNVHFQHSATLTDVLMGAGVGPEKLAVQWFTDSAHSISYNTDNTFLYKQLTMRLYEEKVRVPGSELTHQWSRREVMLEG